MPAGGSGLWWKSKGEEEREGACFPHAGRPEAAGGCRRGETDSIYMFVLKYLIFSIEFFIKMLYTDESFIAEQQPWDKRKGRDA